MASPKNASRLKGAIAAIELAEQEVPLNGLHYPEALDSTHIELCNLENSLGGHPVRVLTLN